MKELSQLTNHHGRTFSARVIERGDRYGLDNCLTYDKDEPVIEVYDDTRGRFGQFTGGRYYLSTFYNAAAAERGIALQGGVPEWTIDAATVIAWAVELDADPALAAWDGNTEALINSLP